MITCPEQDSHTLYISYIAHLTTRVVSIQKAIQHTIAQRKGGVVVVEYSYCAKRDHVSYIRRTSCERKDKVDLPSLCAGDAWIYTFL